MPNHSRQILTHVTIILIAFGIGLCSGVVFYPQLTGPVTVADEESHDEEQLDEGEHVDLTQAAVDNLGLEMGKVMLDDYWKTQTMPGEVIEIPGLSDLSVSAPVAGVVERVAVRDGESVTDGDQLFLLRITDQSITTAQSDLLDILSQLDIANTEIHRLTPLAEDGTVSRKRKRELEYQVRQLEAQRQTKMQEILARGLPAKTLETVVERNQLADQLLISVPTFQPYLGPRPEDFTKKISLQTNENDTIYAVTAIHVHPGLTVKAGDDLCDLSHHGKLYIKGQAFESDLETISKLADSPWRISAEFGHQHHGEHTHTNIRRGLRVLHIDNHVDPETQTFAFYLLLENDALQDLESEGRVYRQWRFKPGQRVHLRVPVEKHEAKMKLPIEAVAIEGPHAIVFRDAHAGHDHGHDEAVAIELEPVDVHVLLRDDRYVIIDPEGDLRVGDTIAMNNAYKLQLAMRMSAGAGVHEHHDH